MKISKTILSISLTSMLFAGGNFNQIQKDSKGLLWSTLNTTSEVAIQDDSALNTPIATFLPKYATQTQNTALNTSTQAFNKDLPKQENQLNQVYVSDAEDYLINVNGELSGCTVIIEQDPEFCNPNNRNEEIELYDDYVLEVAVIKAEEMAKSIAKSESEFNNYNNPNSEIEYYEIENSDMPEMFNAEDGYDDDIDPTESDSPYAVVNYDTNIELDEVYYADSDEFYKVETENKMQYVVENLEKLKSTVDMTYSTTNPSCEKLVRSGIFEIQDKNMDYDKNQVFFKYGSVIYVIPDEFSIGQNECNQIAKTDAGDVSDLNGLFSTIGD